MKIFNVVTCLSALSLVLLSACASYPSERFEDRGYSDGDTHRETYDSRHESTPYGVVSGIDVIELRSRPSGGGAVLGAVLGAVIGNQVGSGRGRAAATGAGAVGGAVIGYNMEKNNRRDDEFYRVSVRFEDRRTREFDYERIDDLRVGDRVLVERGELRRTYD
ncbi:MAG: glycine zipper 2TM domain-containing protein [Pseudomonadota bacterium]|nr:glycine zipper 2TM domain-containing protein [Pseudomonadota bacterium]